MKITISEKTKKDLFVSIFQVMKHFSNAMKIVFKEDNMFIQGMDRSHISLFEIKIMKNWFSGYDRTSNDKESICLDTNIFFNVISMCSENHTLIIEYDDDPDNINIKCVCENNKKGDFEKFFNIPLLDIETEYFEIPDVDYQVDFSINSKKMNEIISQLLIFGDVLNIKCCEENIKMISTGVSGEMNVNIPVDDLTEYSFIEYDDELNVSFGLGYIQKMCVHPKIASEISVSISNDYPMRMKYELGNDSHCIFYLAPKSED